LIGASKEAIEKAEDRKLFDIAMRKMDLNVLVLMLLKAWNMHWKFKHVSASQ
jgi:carbamoylphosphate synthase large subunit